MFVAIPQRGKSTLRWATPLLIVVCVGVFIWLQLQSADARAVWLSQWGELSAHPVNRLGDLSYWYEALLDGSLLRPLTALFLHADWPHLLGNLAFLLIFGLPAERSIGAWRLLLLFLLGGALANLVAKMVVDTPGLSIIGASGAISAVIGAYLALFPRAQLGLVLPLGIFLEFVRVPAPLLIGVWVLLQVVFAYIGPSFGEVAWIAHIAGFLIGVAVALLWRSQIKRRLRRQRGY